MKINLNSNLVRDYFYKHRCFLFSDFEQYADEPNNYTNCPFSCNPKLVKKIANKSTKYLNLFVRKKKKGYLTAYFSNIKTKELMIATYGVDFDEYTVPLFSYQIIFLDEKRL